MESIVIKSKRQTLEVEGFDHSCDLRITSEGLEETHTYYLSADQARFLMEHLQEQLTKVQ